MNVFITGGSGFLGSALIARMVPDTSVKKLFVLIRPSARHSAEARIEQMVERIFPPAERPQAREKIIGVAGDLTLSNLGLDEKTRERLRADVERIVHVGASTDFSAPLVESRDINVEGTRRLLDFALSCMADAGGKLERLDYVSTAFVAGTRRGIVSEKDLGRGQSFANAYEQSKYEAELLVRTYMAKLPTVIHRPSIIVGDSRNGFTPHFKVLYWPLVLLAKNIIPFIPVNRHARLDIVPIDFVADAMLALLKDQSLVGKTLHLTAGKGNEVRIGQLLEDAFRLTSIARRPIISPLVFRFIRATPLRRLFSDDFWRTSDLASVYTAYLEGTGVTYDCTETAAILRRHGISCPRWNHYREQILNYCISSRWGKRPAKAEYLYHWPALAEG